jgi:alcohol dehydrogenase
MRAVVMTAVGETPGLRNLPEPGCPDAGVVIRVGATGVCRSDWHAWMGHDPVALPHVPGHEFAGVIHRVGPLVRQWSVGDRVTVPFVCACGRCTTCRRGDAQVCERQTQPGFTHHGSFAEQVAVHSADVNLVALPDNLDDVTAAALGCRLATAYRAVVHLARVGQGDWLSVHGCGGVGLSAVMVAAARGARVIAVDVSVQALQWARRLGAEVAIDARLEDVPRTVRALTGGGADASVDALGSRVTLADALAGLRPRGRHIQVGLMLGDQAMPPVDMAMVVSRELQLSGSHGMAARDYPQLLGEIAEGRLRPEWLVARVIGLDEAPAALAALGATDQGPGTTVVVPGLS